MKFLSLLLIFSLLIFGKCHELKGFTLKQFQFLYQIFTGDFVDLKKKEKVEKANVKNETSSYYGSSLVSILKFKCSQLSFRLPDIPRHLKVFLV